jgi:hypothetical protein
MPPVTSKVPGNGTGTVSWTVPGDGMDVETVYASVDATGAGGAVTAEITITDQSGVVIARKVQGSTITAGGTGSATWALRLDDETVGGGGGITSITSTDGSVTVTNPAGPITNLAVFKPSTYEFLSSNTMTVTNGSSGAFTWSHTNGSSLMDLTNTTAPLVKVAGVYAIVCQISVTTTFTAGGYAVVVLSMGDGTSSSQVQNMILDSRGQALGYSFAVNNTHYMNALARFSVQVDNEDGASSRNFLCNAYVVRIT